MLLSKKILSLLFLSGIYSSWLSAEVPTNTNTNPSGYTALSSQEMANYYQQLQAEIQKADDYTTKVMKDSNAPGHIISPVDRMKLETAATMMEVKKTLVGNFAGTPSLQSPLVREKLLNILKKDIITTADLLELQHLVDQERPKVESLSTKP